MEYLHCGLSLCLAVFMAPNARDETQDSYGFLRIGQDRCVVQDQKPSIVFEDENVRRVGLFAAHLLAGGHRDVFEAGHPGDRSLHFDRYLGNIDSHERSVLENLFPACANVFPPGQAIPTRIDADGAGIGRPHLIHEIDIEAFQGEVELKIRLNDLFRIGHQEEWFITNLGGV